MLPSHLRRLSILLFLCALPAHLEAQSLQLQGRVLDAETGAPLAGANVASGSAAASTDHRGNFALNIAAGDTITVSFVGYESVALEPRVNPSSPCSFLAGGAAGAGVSSSREVSPRRP